MAITDGLAKQRVKLIPRVVLAALLVLPAVIAISVVTTAPAGALGSVLYVAQSGTDSGDCSTPATACATITYALTMASDGATINVWGTIHDNVNILNPTDLTITGASAPANAPAIVDGSGLSRVFAARGTVVLDHLIIQNGDFGSGAGIGNFGNMTVTNSTIRGNHVDTVGGSGGGIFSGGTELTIINSTITGNTSSDGAGVAADSGTVTIANSVVSNNIDSGSPDPVTGGGIAISNATATITNSTISGNSAGDGDGGGISFEGSGSQHISNSTITGNSSGQRGGGVFALEGNLSMVASTVEGNTATLGGAGLELENAGATIIGSTLENSGASNIETFLVNLTLGSTILHRSDGVDCNSIASTTKTSLGYNFDDGTCLGTATGPGDNTTNVDPLLGPLKDNGGPTPTMALLTRSPAIGVIPDPTTTNQTPLCPRVDQRGLPSIPGTACDSGAYQSTTVAPQPAAITSASAVTFMTGTPGSFTVTATGVPVPTLWSAGILPAGVTFRDNHDGTATLSGTPAAGTAGDYPLTFTASNSFGPDAIQNFSLHVQEALYVAQSGTDSGDCSTPATACATITYALTMASDGATINVWGTIHDNVNILNPTDLTITGASAPANAPAIVDGSGLSRVFAARGTVVLDHLIIQNGDFGSGAGIGNFGNMTITNSTIRGNHVDTVGGSGGGIFSGGTELTIINSTITGNTSSDGAGVAADSGTVTIANSVVSNNIDSGSPDPVTGGGIAISNATATITNSTISGNSAGDGDGGGISFEGSGSQHISNSTITGNSSGQRGGGVFALEGNLSMVASTVEGNTATLGGAGLELENAGATIIGSTLENSGASNIETFLVNLTLGSTILHRSDGVDCNSIASTTKTSLGYNFDDGTCLGTATGPGDNTTNVDPLLGPLKDNGGPTPTMALLTRSPAIGVIPDPTTTNQTPLCPRVDQRGLPSIPGTACDSGAYQSTTVAPQPAAITSASAVTFMTGTPGSFTVTATGVPVPTLWSAGILPAGVTFRDNHDGTATLSGTPAAGTAGDYPLTFTASNSFGPDAIQNFSFLGQGSQAITFTSSAPAGAKVGAAPYLVTATGGGSNNAVTFTIDPSSSAICSISGSSVSFTAIGTCVIDANQAGNANFTAAPQAQQSFVVGQGSQAITFTSSAPAGAKVGAAPYLVTATGGGSNNAVTFTIDPSSSAICSISGSSVSFTAIGTCVIDANQAGNANFTAAPQAQQSFVVGQGSQAITFTSSAPAGAKVGAAPYLVTATGGGSNNAVTFTIDPSSSAICSISGSSVSFTAIGTCVIDANQAGNANFTAAPQAQQSFVVGQGSQAITFTSSAPAGAKVGAAPYLVTATGGGSNNAVTFTIDPSSSAICSISGSSVSFTAIGTCVIDANQAGNANFTAAPQAQQSFVVGQGSQAITFTSSAPAGAKVGAAPYLVTATGGGSNNAVTFTIDPSSSAICSISGSSVSFTAIGTCVIDANQAGNANFTAAPQAQQSFVVGQGSQAITFTSSAPAGAKVGAAPYLVTATGGGSNNAVTFTIDPSSSAICSISGSSVSFTAIGTCVIDANQAGNANFTAAPQAQQSFVVGQGSQAITFTSSAPAGAKVGAAPYLVTATGGGSNNAVTFTIDPSSSAICSISGSSVSFTAIGTCVIDANQAGNANFTAAPQAQQSFVVGQGSQAITFTSSAPAGAKVGAAPYLVTATGGGSNNAVTFTIDPSSSAICSISGSSVSFTAIGTCVIDANQAGNANFTAAPQAQQSFVVGQGSQAITFTSSAPAGAKVGAAPYLVTATGGGSNNAVTFTIDPSSSAICSISGSSVSFTAIGTCVIDANQAGNANFTAAPQAQQSFVVGQGSQAITFTSSAPAGAKVGAAPYLVTATGGGSNNAVTFTIDPSSSAICSISGSSVSFTAIGTCVIDANQAGNANFTAAPQAQQSFVVGQGSQAITFTSSAPAGAKVGAAPYLVTATGGGSNNAVTFTIDPSSSAICSISGSSVSFTAIGTCVIDANQAGNANFTAAPQAQQSFVVGQGSTSGGGSPGGSSSTHGYWLIGSDGGVFSYGSAKFFGSTAALLLNRPIIGMVPTADGGGYWLVASDGGVFAFGDAGFYGSIPGLGLLAAGSTGPGRHLNAPIVAIVPSLSGHGYFMVAADGGVFAFGDAAYEGSCPGIGGCQGAAVAVVPDGSGSGYWLTTATGNVYTFGDAPYLGAPGGQPSAITAMARSHGGAGYWIMDANGQVFAYGDAPYLGAPPLGSVGGVVPASAIFTTSDGGGYWICTTDGTVYAFGDAPFDGDATAIPLNGPIVAATGY